MKATVSANDSTDEFTDECLPVLSYGIIFNYCVMSLCVLVGAPAHSWCLWFYLRGGWRIGPNQMFHVHHIIIELVACVENAVDIFNTFIFQNETLSLLNNFIFGASWTGRSLIQACVCMEQYVAVLHPVAFLKYKAMRYKLGAVGAVYLISSCYGGYQIKYYEFPDPIFNSTSCIVVIVIIFCCVSVLRALKRSGPGHTHGNRSRGQEEEDQRKKKAFNAIFTIFLIMLFTYVPMIVLSACYVLRDDWVLYYCILGPILGSTNPVSLMITPLLKIYQEGCLKRIR